MDALEVLGKLAEIAHRGGPAQQRAARELIDRIGEEDPKSWGEAERLIDAYLNDPYLTRDAD